MHALWMRVSVRCGCVGVRVYSCSVCVCVLVCVSFFCVDTTLKVTHTFTLSFPPASTKIFVHKSRIFLSSPGAAPSISSPSLSCFRKVKMVVFPTPTFPTITTLKVWPLAIERSAKYTLCGAEL